MQKIFFLNHVIKRNKTFERLVFFKQINYNENKIQYTRIHLVTHWHTTKGWRETTKHVLLGYVILFLIQVDKINSLIHTYNEIKSIELCPRNTSYVIQINIDFLNTLIMKKYYKKQNKKFKSKKTPQNIKKYWILFILFWVV